MFARIFTAPPILSNHTEGAQPGEKVLLAGTAATRSEGDPVLT